MSAPWAPAPPAPIILTPQGGGYGGYVMSAAPAMLAAPPLMLLTPASMQQGAPSPNMSSPWAPWEGQWTETSIHGFVKAVPRTWYRWRWAASYPLQWRVLWGRFTVGELLFFAGALGAAGGAMAGTWKDVSGSGVLASIPMFLTLTLATHNSVWTFVFGLPFERAMFWHALVAYLAVGMGLYHGLMSWRFGDDAPVAGAKTVGDWALPVTDSYFITGWGLLGSMLLLWATSALPHLRRWAFQAWYVSHLLLVLLTIGFAFAHSAVLMAVGLGFWALDLLIRYAWMAGFKHPKQVELLALPGDVVRIAWPKDRFEYSGGQYCFICIPALSWFEWHPFSVSSHPSQDVVYLHVRALGTWTKALSKLASSQMGGSVTTRAFIEGPYGSPAIDILGDRYDSFLLISGGIGVTPMQSVLNDLLLQSQRGRSIKLLRFVWSVRDKHMLNSVLDHKMVGLHQGHQLNNPLPASFSPNLVSPNIRVNSLFQPPGAPPQQQAPAPGKQDFLHTEFYLTRLRDETLQSMPLLPAEVQAALRTGRPNLPQIFASVAQTASTLQSKGPPRVAVLVCGPEGMIQEVRSLCSGSLCGACGTPVRFELHAEVFEL